MSQLREYYRSQADRLFKPNAINDPEDADFILKHCQELMTANKVPWIGADEDDWLEFVYRCQELMELHENGYYYHKVRQPDGSTKHILETLEFAS